MPRARRIALCVLPLLPALFLTGCDVSAIWVSRSELNFERDTSPMYFDIANDNANLDTIDVSVTTDRYWIQVAPEMVPCKPPEISGLVKNKIEVRIDRSRITQQGENEGAITLSASGVKPVIIKVKVVQDELTPTLAPLNILNPVVTYSSPYLVEFSFSLRDGSDRSVTGEPAQFQVSGWEDDVPVGRPQGLLLRRGAARQLWIEIILDYSVLMDEIENAIPEMERAATEILLPSLNEDALVSVSGFYRDNLDSQLVVPYTVDRQYVTDRILAAEEEHFSGWASGARIYDALASSLARFDALGLNPLDEKYIVLLCNGRDTSSVISAPVIINAAKNLGVRIIAVGFGDSIDAADLITLAIAANGRFISASSLDDLQSSFERIIEDLNGQYVVRWASLRRDGMAVVPSIKLVFGASSATCRADKVFRAQSYVGDPLRGNLVLMQSDTPGNTTVFLRAGYVPYDINVFRLRVMSDYTFETSVVGPGDDGLLAGWNMTIEDDVDGAKWITLTGGAPIPFASFGAMLRFDFDQAVDTPFTAFEADNSLYNDGQSFVVSQ